MTGDLAERGAVGAYTFGVCAASALTLLLVGCAADSGGDQVEISSIPQRSGTVSPARSLLASYFPSDADLEVFARARAALTGDCMSRFGYTAKTYGGMVGDDPVDLIEESTPVVKLPRTLAQAGRWGYHEAGPATHDTSAEPHEEVDKFSRLELAVLVGSDPSARTERGGTAPRTVRTLEGGKVPPGGCAGEAERKLRAGTPELPRDRGASPTPVNVLLGLQRNAWEMTQEHPRFQEMVSTWSACMKREGYPYTSLNDPVHWLDKNKVTDEERADAEADVRCRTNANYLGVVEALLLAYEEREVEDEAELLQDVEDYYNQQRANAAKALR